MVNTLACCGAAAPEFPKPPPVASAVPEASIITLETQTNTEIVAHSVEEVVPPKAESIQSNIEVIPVATEELVATQSVTASEDSKEQEAPAQEAVVQNQDLVEDLKGLVEPTAQGLEVTTEEQPVAAEECVGIGDVVDGLPVAAQIISKPQREEALSDSLTSMSVEGMTEDDVEEKNVVATTMEEIPVDLTVDVVTQNEILAENKVVARSEAVQAKVQANHAGPSLSSQHLPGGSMCEV